MQPNPTSQYADDTNLSARQAMWSSGRREPPFELYPWVLGLAGLDRPTVLDVLDVGCGNGGYERALVGVGHTGRRVALDLSAGMLAEVAGAERAHADVQALPFADASFDVVLAPHMLYHVPDIPLAAAEMRRVLRRDGVLVAVTNSSENLGELRSLVEEAVGGGWRMVRPADANFKIENGAEPLSTAFERVDTVWCPRSDLVVDDPGLIADYVGSVADHYEVAAGVPWVDVVDRVRVAAASRIASAGELRFNTAAGAFVCR